MHVVVAAAADVEAQLGLVLRELLGRLQVEVQLSHQASIEPARVLQPPDQPEPALARVFVDATADDAAIVYLVDAAWQRVLVRRLPLEGGLDEVAREQVAHVVKSAIVALAAGGQIGVSRAEAQAELGIEAPRPLTPEREAPPTSPPPPPPPPPPAAPRPRRASARGVDIDARAGVGWVLSPWTPQTLAQGPELKLRLGWGRGRFAWGGGVSGRYLLEREVRSSLAGMSIEGVGVRAMGHVRYALEPRLGVLASCGLGFDRETFRPSPSPSSSVLLGTGGARTSGMLAASLGLEVRVLGPVWLAAEAGADFDLAPDDYVVGHGRGFVAIAEPLRLRPTFSTLLALAL